MGALSLGVVYLIAVFILFMLGKYFFDLTHRKINLKEELVERDNLALALSMGGYFIGLTLAVGGGLAGPSVSITMDLIDIFLYGIIAILLLHLSVRINDWLILYRFSSEKEIIQDKNCGVGIIEAGNHVAMGMIINGAVASGGDIKTVLVFWILGQLTLVVASWVYCKITGFNVLDAIEKDNVAVGTAFAGMLLAVGNLIRFAVSGTFVSWAQNLGFFATVVVFGLIALPLVRKATDKLVLPGQRLTDELIHQENPNIGAGVIEGVVYIAMSFLIGWCFA